MIASEDVETPQQKQASEEEQQQPPPQSASNGVGDSLQPASAPGAADVTAAEFPKAALLVVLDIDQTLMSTGFKLRPGAVEFMEFVFKHFKWVAIWTAACDERIDMLLKALGYRWTRKDFLFTWDATRVTNHYIVPRGDTLGTRIWSGASKMLKKVWKKPRFRKLGISNANTVIVDDCHSVCRLNHGNHIPIEPYYPGNVLDKALEYLRWNMYHQLYRLPAPPHVRSIKLQHFANTYVL